MSDTITLVKTQSPVEDTQSFLYKWDSAVRKNFLSFETAKSKLSEGINSLYHNPLTKFRDPVQFTHRYEELESIKLRQ